MFAFTIIGFVIESGKYLDFQLEVLADTPAEAAEKIRQRDRRAVVSTVSRSHNGWSDGF